MVQHSDIDHTGLTGVGGSVAADAIWDAAGDLAVGSGANTAAKLSLGAVGGVVGRINGAVAWNGGTAFPGSKATGDRFWRSDLGSEFYWDGTRWLSTVAREVPMVFTSDPPLSASGVNLLLIMPTVLGGTDLLLSGFSVSFYVQGGTGLSGSHKWVGSIDKLNTAGGSSIGTITIDSGASDQWRQGGFVSVNALAGISSNYCAFQVNWTKTGTPGGLWSLVSLVYRTVAT